MLSEWARPARKRPASPMSGTPPVIPCVAATNSNQTLSGLTAVDSTTIATGDRVLVNQQSTASQNGIYIVNSGTWVLLWSFYTGAAKALPRGTLVTVYGTTGTNAKSMWEVTAANTVNKCSGASSVITCICASTANVASLSGLSSMDGITPTAGDYLLIWKQTTASENGIYIAAAGAWTKLYSFSSTSLGFGQLVTVYKGTTFFRVIFMVDATNSCQPGRVGF